MPDREVGVSAVGLGDLIRDVLGTYRRGWLLLMLSLIAAATVSAGYILTATPTYTANGAILIDPRVGRTPDSGQLAPAVLMSDALTVDSEIRVLTSREVTNAVVEALRTTAPDLSAPDEASPGLRQRLIRAFGLDTPEEEGPLLSPEDRAARDAEARRRNFVRNLSVERAGNSFVIDIAYSSSDPARAALAVNTVLQEYLSLAGRQNVAVVERNRAWLEDRIADLEVAVEEAETAVTEYRLENKLLIPEGGLLPAEVGLNAAVETLVDLRGEALTLAVQIDQLKEQISAGEIEAVRLTPDDRKDALGEFEARFAELQQQEKELLLNWEADAPIILNVRQQLRQTRDLILGEYQQALERLETDQEATNRKVQATEQLIAQLSAEYGQDAQKTVKLRNLEREAGSKRELYERLLEQYNSTSQLLTFDATSARVIAWAVPPANRSAPQSRQVLALAIFAAFVLASSVIFLREALDNTFRAQADLTRDLGLRFSGLIPKFSSERAGRGAFLGLWPRPGGVGGPDWLPLRRPAQWFDFAARNPSSVSADTFRMLHAQLSIRRATQAGPEGAKIIGMTSSVKGEGKTTTSANFAAFLSQNGERVALIDLDLVTTQLSALMLPNTPEQNDLMALLEAPGTRIADLQPIPDFQGVVFIGGIADPPPSYLTPNMGTRLADLFDAMRAQFDYVILDMPPMQGTADAQVIAGLSDHLLLVVRWGQTHRGVVQTALRSRGIARSDFLGALFSRAPLGRYRAYNTDNINSYYD